MDAIPFPSPANGRPVNGQLAAAEKIITKDDRRSMKEDGNKELSEGFE